MQQYIKDLKEYLKLESVVKSLARHLDHLQYYDTPLVQNMTINGFMKNWENTEEGSDFWWYVSQGKYGEAIHWSPHLYHLFSKEPLSMIIINNGLFL